MDSLREYLKVHRRKKPNWANIAVTVLCGWNVFCYSGPLADREENTVFLVVWVAAGLFYLYADFFQMPGEKEIPFDPRPTDERLREAFAGLSQEDLQAIINDDLRSETTKAIAKELLKQ